MSVQVTADDDREDMTVDDVRFRVDGEFEISKPRVRKRKNLPNHDDMRVYLGFIERR
jgi:hypothetical protein